MEPTSPLAIIEQAVQERAREETVGARRPTDERMRELVIDEVQRWQDDHRRGLRSFPIADPEALTDRALRNLIGYGPLEPLLADEDVWEVMWNTPHAIFVKRHRGPSGLHHEVFHDDAHVQRTLTKILDDNAVSHRTLDPAQGLQDAQLRDGSRLHIVHGDLARGGHTIVNVRKHTGVPVRSLQELVERGTLTNGAARFLAACMKVPLSVVFAGAPGSGKTTMMSCCLAELDPSLRVVVAEEVFEADVPLHNVAQLQTRPARPDRAGIDLRHLVAGFLRMAPDVAIVGEVRDREALPLLLTLSSGVKGCTTIHAGSARQALTRLRFVCQLADTGSELPLTALNTLVSEAVDVVVHAARTPEGVRVNEIACVEDLAAGPESAQFTMTELFRRVPGQGLRWTGEVPQRVGRAMEHAGIDVRGLLEAER